MVKQRFFFSQTINLLVNDETLEVLLEKSQRITILLNTIRGFKGKVRYKTGKKQ